MEIQGKVQCEIALKSAKLFPSTNTKMAVVRLSARLDKAGAKRVFGDAGELMFPSAGCLDDVGKYHHPYAHPTPEVTIASHIVQLLDKKLTLCPELAGVTAVDEQEAVDVEIDLPIEITKSAKAWFGELATNVGESVEVEFAPQVLALPLGEAREQAAGQKSIKVPGPHGAPVM